MVLQVVAVASLPKEIAAGLHPKQNNAIRGLLLQSGWVVEKLEDDSCMVTYVVQVSVFFPIYISMHASTIAK
jgi:type III secretory pathway lipoprotein EscJ